ncbi:SDR family NAD(P)-dependent oxidoreductase [Rhodococcus globerulus]|uniref:SDR family NAD(P)-dependent oxidoreductase n=1 Tax=Rhodococcus globerulus TaxID=33008 RepID=A0ABU4C3R1_RHOGO|nr:SDR family NAD(P)-dependent oxidoreductase [Rhodococcus globerulus]MDV6271141.1 SDR family NAD(P)-dependent oxidoreductase [Rhodococcus globerulus]
MKLRQEQVAVVTGGASGIGLALCEEFAKRGLHVVISDIDDTSLAAAAERLSSYPGKVLTSVVDVTDAAAVDGLAHETIDKFGRVDVICNNAGTVGKNMPIWEFERVEWEWIFGVDLWGVIHGISSFVPHLVAQGSGHVVNTASMAGITTVPLNGPYNAAKEAVMSISDTLLADLKQRAPEVGVTVLCPGPTKTRLLTEGPRDRPDHLKAAQDNGIDPTKNPNTFAGSGAELSLPEDVARMTLEAVERNQFLLAPHSGSRDRFDQRIQRWRNDISE